MPRHLHPLCTSLVDFSVCAPPPSGSGSSGHSYLFQRSGWCDRQLQSLGPIGQCLGILDSGPYKSWHYFRLIVQSVVYPGVEASWVHGGGCLQGSLLPVVVFLSRHLPYCTLERNAELGRPSLMVPFLHPGKSCLSPCVVPGPVLGDISGDRDSPSSVLTVQ